MDPNFLCEYAYLYAFKGDTTTIYIICLFMHLFSNLSIYIIISNDVCVCVRVLVYCILIYLFVD